MPYYSIALVPYYHSALTEVNPQTIPVVNSALKQGQISKRCHIVTCFNFVSLRMQDIEPCREYIV